MVQKTKIQVLIDFGNKVNTMPSIYILKLGLTICHTNVTAQKINICIFKTFRIVLNTF